MILSIILLAKLKTLKKSPEKKIRYYYFWVKSFNFTEFSLELTYKPSKGKLGLAGRLILDCYSDTCHKTK